jgi:streptomycin 6-kinase
MRRMIGVQLFSEVPPRAIGRLTEHYGQDVASWLADARQLVERLAAQWGVRLLGFHDGGWTSIIAIGTTASGTSVVIKATPDRLRFSQERAALSHWTDVAANALLAADDDSQTLLLSAVSGLPGGRPRPDDHEYQVASALGALHVKMVPSDVPVPLLAEYYNTEVVPRIARRAGQLSTYIPLAVSDAVLRLCGKLCSSPGDRAMLHSDLYAENVLFEDAGSPVFIDPHPKVGDPAFDWAFWCVYYTPLSGFERRLELARVSAPCPVKRICQWAATLAADGALHYLENDDTQSAVATRRILGTPTVASVLSGA